jgi:hypothetical protein
MERYHVSMDQASRNHLLILSIVFSMMFEILVALQCTKIFKINTNPNCANNLKEREPFFSQIYFITQAFLNSNFLLRLLNKFD